MMNRDVVRQWANMIAVVVTLIVNFASEAIPLNGQTSAEISNRVPILFVPANYVFSVWGVIYVLLIAFGVYQALPSQKANPLLRRIGYWFVLTCVANATWLILFHYNLFALSLLMMVVLLAGLVTIYMRIRAGGAALSNRDRWFIHLPFSVYLGWITVATVANAAYVLYDAGWGGFGLSAEVWTVVMLAVAGLLTLAMIVIHRDVAYTAVIVWALVGIVIKQAGTPVVAYAAGLVALIVVVTLVFRLFVPPNSGQRNLVTHQA
jgi:benzodiazapine receptor